jgi:hypothetical protein
MNPHAWRIISCCFAEVCSIKFNSHRAPPILMDNEENSCRFGPRSLGGGCPGHGLSGREIGAAD